MLQLYFSLPKMSIQLIEKGGANHPPPFLRYAQGHALKRGSLSVFICGDVFRAWGGFLIIEQMILYLDKYSL